MSNRKLVSVQEITGIDPIEGADRVEVARVLGWRVVVGKDMHLKPGDRVAYFETDSLLPAYDPRYKAFQARGQKTMIVGAKEITGHVLRTMKLAENYTSLYAIVGFPSITEPAHTLCSLLNFDLDILTVRSAEEVRHTLERLKQGGYRMVVCDTRSPCRWAACRSAGSTHPAPSRTRPVCRRSPNTGMN